MASGALEAALSLESLSRALALEGLAARHAGAVEHRKSLQELFGEGGRFFAAEHPVSVFVKIHQPIDERIRGRPAAKWAARLRATEAGALATAKPWPTITASPPRFGAVAFSRRHWASREGATGKTLARAAAWSAKAASWAKRPRESWAKFFAAEAAVAVFVERFE